MVLVCFCTVEYFVAAKGLLFLTMPYSNTRTWLNCFSEVLQEERLRPFQVFISLHTCPYSLRSEKEVSSPLSCTQGKGHQGDLCPIRGTWQVQQGHQFIQRRPGA